MGGTLSRPPALVAGLTSLGKPCYWCLLECAALTDDAHCCRAKGRNKTESVAEVDEEEGNDTSFRGSVTEQLAQMQAAIEKLEAQVAQLMKHAKT